MKTAKTLPQGADERDGARWISAFADVDISYGATWVRDYGDYAEVIEIIDLDSATGAAGLVLVEEKSVGFYTRSLREAITRYKNADISVAAAEVTDRERHRARVWEQLASYGYGDIHRSTVVALSTTTPDRVDDWTVIEKVNGKSGLIAYLRAAHGLSFTRDNQATDTPQRTVNRLRRRGY